MSETNKLFIILTFRLPFTHLIDLRFPSRMIGLCFCFFYFFKVLLKFPYAYVCFIYED